MAELRPYNPTWRDRLAQALMGDGRASPERQRFVEGLVGSSGLGNTGMSIADFVPGVGQTLAAQEAFQAGDMQGAGLAIMPVPGARQARTAGKELAHAIESAPFPEFAERYPPVAPPAMMTDPRSGKEYLGKVASPEAEAFMKERARIAKDMEKNGFEPYFPPEERFDVDPSHYPTDVRTVTQNLPKKADTQAKYRAQLLDDPEVMARLEEAYLKGKDIPGAENWYWMGQLEKAFIDELGPEAGRKAFRERFAGSMAATTGGSDPTSNLLAAHYGNYLRATGQPYPQAAYEMPSPIGGRYITGNMDMHSKMGDAGFYIGAENPKRHDFMYNFLGHGDKATIDEQMMGLLSPGGPGAPPSAAYGHFEEPVHALAQKYGVDPRYAQEVMWAGGKAAKNEAAGRAGAQINAGTPMIQTVNEAIERTHRLTGMPKDEIVRRGLVRGEIPLYGLGAALGAGVMMRPEGEQQP